MLLALALGCTSSVQSIRAYRQHSREPAKMKVVLARLDTIRKNLKLVETLLNNTPYTPGADWSRKIALDERKAERISGALERGKLYRDENLRIPVALLYQRSVTQALQGASHSKERLRFKSVMAALTHYLPSGKQLQQGLKEERRLAKKLAKARKKINELEMKRSRLNSKKQKGKFKQLSHHIQREERKEEKLKAQRHGISRSFQQALSQTKRFGGGGAEAAQALKDLINILSVAVRLEAEALALVPISFQQGFRLVSVRQPKNYLKLIGGLKEVATHLETQTLMLLGLTEKLCTLKGIDLGSTQGWAYAASASDLVKGFALDSFYFDLKAGGEMLLFHNIAGQTDEEKEGSGDEYVRYNYDARQFHLEYEVEPIIFAEMALDVGFDALKIPHFLNLDLNYKTDRVYRSGGEIERSGDALSELGAKGHASDVISAGLSAAGVRGGVKRAQFNSGKVRLINDASGEVVDEGPMPLTMTQVDLSYDLTWALNESNPIRGILDELILGFRALRYELPRILYEFEDRNGNPKQDEYHLIAESEVQLLESDFYMGGLQLSRRALLSERWQLLLGLGLYLGTGPMEYSIDEGSQPEEHWMFSFMGDGQLGLAYAFASPRSRWQLDLQLVYDAQFVLVSSIDDPKGSDKDSDLGDKKVTFGSVDLFHGPTAGLKMAY